MTIIANKNYTDKELINKITNLLKNNYLHKNSEVIDSIIIETRDIKRGLTIKSEFYVIQDDFHCTRIESQQRI